MQYYEIRPFDLAEAETVAHWASDADDVRKLTGENDGPLTSDKVIAWTWETHFSFTLRRQGDVVAYAEVLEDEADNDVEIQHLLVAPDCRGAGVGRAMLERLCAFIRAARPYQEVWMRVGRDNEAAARCALAAGFVFDETHSGPRYAWYKKELTD